MSGAQGRLGLGIARLALLAALLVALLVALPVGGVQATLASSAKVVAIGAENEYANVIAQIGGRYVRASGIMSNPATDPHTYEASPKVAQQIAAAALVVQNGAGYDTFMSTIEAASPSARRRVIVVQSLLHRSKAVSNPHLWYSPSTMPVVAAKIEKDLAALDPSHGAAFDKNLARFDRSLSTWKAAIHALRQRFAHAPVATTEPVADDMLQAAGIDDKTPYAFQSDIMNGVDPSPQDLAYVQNLLTHHKVKALVYNQQVTDTLTQSLLAIARQHHIPVVGVYETMPTPGYDYQSWMTAEVQALTNALAHGTSAPKL